MEKSKFKLAVKCIAMCVLTLLFFGSFSYTFIVYFEPEEKELEDEIDIDQICRPYSNNLQDRQTSNPEIGNLLQNISVNEIYTDHPKCLDVLLPVMCSLAYAVTNEDDLDMSGGWTINSDNYNLLEECNSVLPSELFLLATQALPIVNFQDITCADGFYLLNYTCRPHCTQFEQVYHSSATTKIGIIYFSTISNVILTSLFLVLVCINRKTMLKLPSVLFLYIILLYSVWPLCILINFLSGRTLVCSDDDLIKSLQQPSAYCVITGVLIIIHPCISVIWIVTVAMIFWKILFPINARLHQNLDKWIHASVPVLVIIIVLPYIITITISKDFLPVQSGFPTSFCSSRHRVFNFSYIVFSSVFLCSLGMFLLMIILFHIQMRFGWSIWRKDVAINTAEKKILLLLFIVGCVAALNGIFYTLSVTAHTKLSAALYLNFLCELPGYIMDKENDMTTCSKDELEKHSYTGLSNMTTIFTYALLPLVFLLTNIPWQSFVQRMKVLFQKKKAEQETVLSLTKLSSLVIQNET